jgi:hypothetical protein
METDRLVCAGIVADQDGRNHLLLSVVGTIYVGLEVPVPPCCTIASASQLEDCV